MGLTTEAIENAGLDIITIGEFVTRGAAEANPGHTPGTVTNRDGDTFDGLQKLTLSLQNLVIDTQGAVDAVTADIDADRDAVQAMRDQTAAYRDTVINAVITSLTNTPPAVDYTTGLGAVANGAAFYLTIDARNFYYLRVSSLIGVLFAVRMVDQDLQKFATYATQGDVVSPRSTLDVHFVGVDALTRPGAIPNRARGSNSLNFLSTNRPSDAGLFEKLLVVGGTLTRLAVGHIAGNYAVRWQYAGSGNGILYIDDLWFPPGQYSLVGSVKSASGTPAFRAGLNGDTGITANVAPAAATRIVLNTLNFTTAGIRDVYVFRQAASPVAADLTFDDFYIVPGDGTVIPAQVLGISSVLNNLMPWSSGALVKSGPTAAASPIHMLAPLGNGPVAVATFSLTLAVKRTGSSGGNQVLWSSPDTADYLLYNDVAGCMTLSLGSAGFSNTYWEVLLPLNTWVVLGVSENGTKVEFYVEGVRIQPKTHTAMTPISSHGVSLYGYQTGILFNFLGEVADLQFEKNYAAGEAEMMSDAKVARQSIVKCGGTYRPCGVGLVIDGDSISAMYTGSGGLSLPYTTRLAASYTPALRVNANFAVSGASTAQLIARLQDVIAQCERMKAAGMTPMVIVEIGINDYQGWTTVGQAQAWADNLFTVYVDVLFGRGYKVFVSTLMADGTNDGTKQAIRDAGNVRVRSYSARCTGIIDYAANANLNVYGATYFGVLNGLVHPNDAGHALMATIAKAVLDPHVALYK